MFAIIICILAGIGAGLGTGFAGLSAAVVISPMLIAFLDVPAYQATGIALASDVLASAISAYTFHKNKNLDIKGALPLLTTVLIFTLVGSFIATFIPNSTLGGLSELMTAFLGLKFIIRPITRTGNRNENESRRVSLIKAIGSGVYIGTVCGFMGAGGGMMLLFALTIVMGYELKCAIGTSVFIMTFTAFTGAASHIYLGGMPNLTYLLVCICSTVVFARIAAVIANRVKPVTLNRITGILLVVVSLAVLISDYIL